MMGKWEYGGAYLRHDMAGEIRAGGGIVKVHDIFDSTPEFMKEADCVFVDPPCSLGNLRSFYTKAEERMRTAEYGRFADRLFEVIDEIGPKRLFVEAFASNREDFEKRIRERFPCVRLYDSSYYHRPANRCWIIQGTAEPEDWRLSVDEEDAIAKICRWVPFDCIADPCMGRGLVGLHAFRNGRRFVGTELNPKRLAVLLDRIEKTKK